jgi:hypothetical protein
MVKTLEFYPPDGLTPGEIGYLADGKIDKEDVISTIVYLADKGYIEIEEIDRKKFKFIAIQEPGEEVPAYVRSIYKGIFPGKGTERTTAQIGSSSTFGNKYLKAKDQLRDMFKGSSAIVSVLLKLMIFTVPPVFIIMVIKGFLNAGEFLFEDVMEALIFAITLAIGLMPEMLATIVSTNLAKGAIDMSKNKVRLDPSFKRDALQVCS